MPSEEILRHRKLSEFRAEIPPDIQMALSDEGTEIAVQAWAFIKQGYDQYTISRRLKVPTELINDVLQQFRQIVVAEAGRTLESFRVLDCERVEELIQHWWPIATGCSLDKILSGEMSKKSVEDCLKAS